MRAVLSKRAARKLLLTTFTKAQIRYSPLLAEIAYVNVNELSTPVGLRVRGLSLCLLSLTATSCICAGPDRL